MSFKTPVCKRPEYTIYLQDIDGSIWAHCDVRKWSSSTAKKLRGDSDALYSMQGGPWFALNDPHLCQKHIKFMRMMGFEFYCSVPAIGAGERHVYKR